MSPLPKRTISDRVRASVDATSAASGVSRELRSFVPVDIDSSSTHQQIPREIAERLAAAVIVSWRAQQQRAPYWVHNPGERSADSVPLALRLFILERDHWTCTYCKMTLTREVAEVDHVNPRADGGPSHALSNLAAACWWCNRGEDGKHRRTPEEWRSWRLRRGLSWPPPQHTTI